MLSDGFLEQAYVPLEQVAVRIDEAASELDALLAQMLAHGPERPSAATDDALMARIVGTMERLPHYQAKAQRVARDMHQVHDKLAALRRRMAAIEQKRQAANTQVSCL